MRALRKASAHYDVMSAEQIRALPVSQLASMNCLIYSRATAPHLAFTVECLKAWGFEYKSFMAWRKTTAAGKVRMGTGYRVRTTGEIVLVGTLCIPKQSHVPPTIFDGIVREHSRKPDEFYALSDL